MCLPVVTFPDENSESESDSDDRFKGKVTPLPIPIPRESASMGLDSRLALGYGKMSTGRPASRLQAGGYSTQVGPPVPTLKLLTVHPPHVIVPGRWLLDLLCKYCKSGGPGVGSNYNQLFWLQELYHKLRDCPLAPLRPPVSPVSREETEESDKT